MTNSNYAKSIVNSLIIFLLGATVYGQKKDTSLVIVPVSRTIGEAIVPKEISDTSFRMGTEGMLLLDDQTNSYFKKQEVEKNTFLIEGYSFKGVSVLLDGKYKSVRKAWKSYLRNTNDIKLRSKKAKSLFNRKKMPYYKASEVALTNVTNRIGDILTVFQTENRMVKMTVIYKLGYNTSITEENFATEYFKLASYVETFSQANFREYYDENIKELERSIKTVKKEIKSESRILRKKQRKYRRFLKKNDPDTFDQLGIDVQQKLINSLRKEENNYHYLIMEYKNRNSQIRTEQFLNESQK